ncbi:MAG: hypothetical protein AB1671_16455 [Thermodesulfobacteriota bacterium]
MTNSTTLLSSRPLAALRRRWHLITVLACAIAVPALAHAHGMEGQELGPPILTSGLLGFVCYWLVMLWPSSKTDHTAAKSTTPTRPGHPRQHAVRVKPAPRLRKIERSGPAANSQRAERKAIDG